MLEFLFRRRPAAEAALAARAEALLREGQALAAQGQAHEALAAFDRALALAPDHPDLHLNRGNALYVLRRPEEALSAFARALALAPHYAGAAYNRGQVLRALGRRDEAIAEFDVALSIRPDYADALNARAVALTERGRFDEALASFERLAAIAPSYPDVLGNIAYAAGQVGDWTARDRVLALVDAGGHGTTPLVAPFVMLSISDDPARQLACARSFVAVRHPPRPALWRGEPYGHRRIRVAYVSADFHDHAVPYLMAGVFESHDRDRFEVTGVSLGPPDESPMRTRLARAFDRFVDARERGERDVARMLRELEIDIAVDLMGHTGGARPDVFAQRPAPVQVNYLGYPGSSGAPYMDYLLADRFVIPEARAGDYSERIVYLPDTFQANDSKRPAESPSASHAAAGLPDAFVFCSFNGGYKITREMFHTWMRVLHGVPGSVLWLYAGHAMLRGSLRRAAAERGIDPARLVFAGRASYPDHLARLRLADVFLDTLPFNGGTTVSDALWAGVPVVTCAGNAFAARMAGSLLGACGLPELVAESLRDYESLAAALGNDRERLHGMKRTLAAQRSTSPLFDTGRFTRHLEAAYETMRARAERGEPPGTFAVERLPA